MQAIANKLTNLINLPLYKKHAGYMFWVMGEQAMILGLPRLVLFPLAAYFIGRQQFGAFVMAMSITYMIGFHPANGLATGMLRQLTQYETDKQKLFCSTAGRMCSWAMISVVAIALTVSFVVFMLNLIEPVLFYCLIPLFIALYPENQFFLNLTELRISRRFATRTSWFAIRSVGLLVCGILGALIGDAVGFACGYAAGNFFAYGVLFVYRKDWLAKGYDKIMASGLKDVWLHISIAGIIGISGPYLTKIILGFYHEYSEVADLFAATALLYAFLVIIGCIGHLLISILGRYQSIEDLPRYIRRQFLFVASVLLVTTPIIFRIASPFIFDLIFPKFGSEARNLLNIVVWAIPFAGLVSLMQPFVVKFAPVKIMPLVNGLTLIGIVVPAVLLIPSFHSAGAAWAIVIGHSIKGLFWTGFAMKLLIFPDKSRNISENCYDF